MSLKQISPIQSIRKTCLLCQGGSRKLIAECDDIICPLHGYRSGTIPPGTAATILKAIRKFCLRCAGCAADANTCKGGTPVGSMDPCALHPYRKGRMPGKKRLRKPRKHPVVKKQERRELEIALPISASIPSQERAG